jgi:hypothetical protein
MSKNIDQVYTANPITSNAGTDLMYFGQSPYGAGNDAAMLYSNFAQQFLAANGTNHEVLIGTGTNAVTSIPLTAGEVLIGTTGGDPAAATLTSGTNINIVSASGAITINATGAGAFTWNNVAVSTEALVANNGYITNNGATLVTYTLPATAAQGTVISIAGFSAGGFTIAQNASQEIFFGTQHTTAGVTGSLSSSNQYDQVSLLCVTANLAWVVINSVGNLTYV